MGIYWTIQTKEAWEVTVLNGVLQGQRDHAMFDEPYTWMMGQMRKRLPKYNDGYPIWVWEERPDLRHSAHLERGTDGVLLKLDLDDSMVLLSDFDAWHCVLNDGFLAIDEAEYDAFDRGELSMTKEESWERIFEPETYSKVEPDWWGTDWRWQGVVEEVPVSQIISVRHFIAK